MQFEYPPAILCFMAGLIIYSTLLRTSSSRLLSEFGRIHRTTRMADIAALIPFRNSTSQADEHYGYIPYSPTPILDYLKSPGKKMERK